MEQKGINLLNYFLIKKIAYLFSSRLRMQKLISAEWITPDIFILISFIQRILVK